MDLKNIVGQIEQLQAALTDLRPLQKEQLERLYQKIRLDWNYNSSSIEGNTLSLSETKSFLFWGMTAKGKPFRDYVEMKGHDAAIKKIYQIISKDLNITESLIKDLHRMILVEPYADEKAEITPGEWKKIHNYLYSPTGERIEFVAPDEVPAKMSNLVNWLNNHIAPPKRKKKKYDLHPLLITAGFHAQFIQIHPFGDGNGRTARLLCNLILMLCGYVPMVIQLDNRKDYYTAINNSSLDNPRELALFMGEALIQSLQMTIKAAKGESIEEPDDLDKKLSLLEQEIRGEGKKIIKIKNKTTLIDFFDNTFPIIIDTFKEVNQKFSKFYVESKFYLRYVSQNQVKKISLGELETLKIIFLELDEHILFINYEYKVFNQSNKGNFNYFNGLKITFNQTDFSIEFYQRTYQNIIADEISYLYDEEINAAPIKAIITENMANPHIAFIQEQLKK